MTSHLESTKDFGEERKRQLKQCFEAVKAEPAGQNVIFGGDLNLRDKEVYFFLDSTNFPKFNTSNCKFLILSKYLVNSVIPLFCTKTRAPNFKNFI